MNILFFFVHPAKFHVFRPVIEKLKQAGHNCDITIISKDVLPELLEKSGFEYTNILNSDRRSKSKSSLVKMLNTLCRAAETIWNLWRYIRCRDYKYDLFITDDCLAFIGKLTHTPVLFFLDDDLNVVPEVKPLLTCASRIIAPQATDVGKFNCKTLAFRGCKECAYLTPKYFTPDPQIPQKYGLIPGKYALIRLVSLSATHDHNRTGLSDDRLELVIDMVKKHDLVPLLSCERNAPERYKELCYKGDASEMVHLLAHAAIYIGDSQTMTSEAVLLGVPAIRCNDFVGKIRVMEEKETKYDMTYGFTGADFVKAVQKADDLLNMKDLHAQWDEKRRKMLEDMDDLPQFIFDIINEKRFK